MLQTQQSVVVIALIVLSFKELLREKNKIYFIQSLYLPTYLTFLFSPFLPMYSTYCLVLLTFLCIFFSISYKASRLAMNFLSLFFFLSMIVFICLYVLRANFSGYRILGLHQEWSELGICHVILFWPLGVISCNVCLLVMSYFSLAGFKIFLFVFSRMTLMCVD